MIGISRVAGETMLCVVSFLLEPDKTVRVDEVIEELQSALSWVVLSIRVPFRLLFIRVPYNVGGRGDPYWENCGHVCLSSL